jgi:NAD(P) transhydrogenase subunit alpha
MVPAVSSELYAKNLTNLLGLLVKDGELAVNFDDEIVKGSCITREGEIVHEATKKAMGAAVTGGVDRAQAAPSTVGRGGVPPSK